MSRPRCADTPDLLAALGGRAAGVEPLSDGAAVLPRFACAELPALMAAVSEVAASAPFRHMTTPGGQRMSAAMTNCGRAGWVADRGGYRYDAIDPVTGRAWPEIPAVFLRLAVRAAAACGYRGFEPDACLVNRYGPAARLSMHQDRNERDFGAPIVSVSMGLPATFVFGGMRRSDRPVRVRLRSGDVVIWGGAARLAFHGVAPLAEGNDPLTGPFRFNLTFRKAL